MTIIIASLPAYTFIEVGLLRMQTHPQEKEDVVVLELSRLMALIFLGVYEYKNRI